MGKVIHRLCLSRRIKVRCGDLKNLMLDDFPESINTIAYMVITCVLKHMYYLNCPKHVSIQ